MRNPNTLPVVLEPQRLSRSDPGRAGKLIACLSRHLEVLWIVLTDLVPFIIRTRSRPVMFSKYSGIGDIICTFPAAKALMERHPCAGFIYNCHPDFVCLPKMAGVSDWVLTTRHIGLLQYWYGFLFAGFYHFASDDDNPCVIPTEVYIKDFGRQFGMEVKDDHPKLTGAPAVFGKVKSFLASKGLREGPLIVIHTGPSWPVREWPYASWVALVQELRKRGYGNIIQLGASRHLTLGSVAQAPIPGVLSLVDQLTLEESAVLISLGDLFIGIDSGLLHIAAAMETPAVGLWGATSPQLRFSATNRRLFVTSRVDCQGCHHRVPREHWITDCPRAIHCMTTLAVGDVLQACLTGLREKKAASVLLSGRPGASEA